MRVMTNTSTFSLSLNQSYAMTTSPPLSRHQLYNKKMGTAASSNSQMSASNAYHLPGGHESIKSTSKVLPNKLSSDRTNSKRSLRNISSPKSENTVRGPMKADHSIKVTKNSKYQSGYKNTQLSPLTRKKSTSLSDLSNSRTKLREGDNDTFKRIFDRNTESSKYGFIGDRDDSNVLERSNQILQSAKLKFSRLSQLASKPKNANSNDTRQLHKRYSSSNDINTVNERIRNINLHNQQNNQRSTQMEDATRQRLQESRANGTFKRSSSELNISIKASKRAVEDDGPSTSSRTRKRHSISGSKRIEYGHGLVGLRNLGNTCYMNCVLQCLCRTSLLREYFFSAYTITGKLAKVFVELMREVWRNDAPDCITPSLLKLQVQRYASRFVGTNQQDAQEFLRFFLEGVHNDLNSVKKRPTYPELNDKHLSDGEKSNVYWQRYLSRENSPMQDLFVGQLKSTLTCSVCDHRSVTYDPFWDLSLPIPARSKTSEVQIGRCFEALTQEEILDGDEKPTCEKCKKRRKCLKGFRIERFPKVLVLHLKRFSEQRYRSKLETKVDFPFMLELKNLSANSLDKDLEPVYQLYGVANHIGGTTGGHYTAYTKHPDTEKWYLCNDARVSETSSSRVVSNSAYVLFYELKST